MGVLVSLKNLPPGSESGDIFEHVEVAAGIDNIPDHVICAGVSVPCDDPLEFVIGTSIRYQNYRGAGMRCVHALQTPIAVAVKHNRCVSSLPIDQNFAVI